MSLAYHNDIDEAAAALIGELMGEGHIPAGVIDTRSIEHVEGADLRRFRQCHFFSGTGGWAYAARLAGWPDGRELWTGSLPCQPWSCAGLQRGANDPRDLWHHQLRLIAERRPSMFVGEQVASAIGKGWLDRAIDDLEALGYACGAVVIPASGVGALHHRNRLWLAANAQRDEQPRQESRGGPAGRVGRIEQPVSWNEPWRGALSRLRILGDGLPRSVAATDAARNAIVPEVAAEFLAALMEAA